MHIIVGGLDDPRVVALLHTHVTHARAETARGSAHALDLDGLRAPGITFWSVWEGDAVVGVGALKRLSADHGEVKSMHTAEAARGRGVGSALLRQIIRDRFAGAEGRSLRSVKRGQGKVLERDGSKVAAYRDRAGGVTLRSATPTPTTACKTRNRGSRLMR